MNMNELELIRCGTHATTKIGKIEGIITATTVSK